MSIFNFTAPDGASFSIKGEGITQAQAQAIFDQQAAAGSLVGLKPGQAISAATQALGGLRSAQSEVLQGITEGLSTNLPGLDSVQNLQGLTAGVPVVDGVNIADLAKQVPSLTNIAQATDLQVKGALAQASKLTGQAADQITNTVGVGKYGFDAQQLETAGFVKSGTAARFLADGTNTLTDVLKSPSVWTGKENINGQADFLASAAKQDLLQTSLMADGVAALNDLGIDTQILDGAALAGTALVAAKGVNDAVDWINGQLPGAESLDFSELARAGEFAADFAQGKMSDAMAQKFPALPAIDTVDRATLNAASTRVLGDPKIPDLNFSVPALPAADELAADLASILEDFNSLRDEAGILEGRIARTPIPALLNEQYDNLIRGGQLLGNLDIVKARLAALKRQAQAKEPPATSIVSQIDSVPVDAVLAQLESALDKLSQRIAVESQA